MIQVPARPLTALRRYAGCVALLAATCTLPAWAAAGKVEFASGDPVATASSGSARPLSKGSELNEAEMIDTRSGRVQIRFTDGGYVSLAPNTRFRIDQYRFNGKPDGQEKGFFSLLTGTLRTFTGLIGKGRKEAYQVSTPTATIGIRGTEYSAAQQGDALRVVVHRGAIVVSNPAGELVVNAGHSALVTGPNQKPAETPNGAAGQPNEGPLNPPSPGGTERGTFGSNTLCMTPEAPASGPAPAPVCTGY